MATKHLLQSDGSTRCGADPKPDGSNVSGRLDRASCGDCLKCSPRCDLRLGHVGPCPLVDPDEFTPASPAPEPVPMTALEIVLEAAAESAEEHWRGAEIEAAVKQVREDIALLEKTFGRWRDFALHSAPGYVWANSTEFREVMDRLTGSES